MSNIKVNAILDASGGTTATVNGALPSPQLMSLSASVATSALTISLPAGSLAFRSTTLGTGTPTTVETTGISLVVPSTATLGTVSAQQSRLVILALNNAGTMELAVVNISGGNNLTETGLISTTAIAAASNTATVIYSTTARTSVAYRVVGYVESTQATAGTWATAPSTVQGCGGQALSAMSSLGYGQTWQNVTGSRALTTTYYNTTGKPIYVNVAGTGSTGNVVAIATIDGVGVTGAACYGTGAINSLSFVVQPGKSYVVSQNAPTLTVTTWLELR